jgi:hypothetical protein
LDAEDARSFTGSWAWLRASLFELQTQAELVRRLGWIQGDDLAGMRELDAVLSGLIRSVRQRMS